LSVILRTPDDWSMRTGAARALERARDEVARESLREALGSDAYAFVPEAAATALASAPLGGDVAALEAAIANDGEPRVRLAALAGLVAVGGEVASRARARAAVDPSELVRGAVN